MVHFHDSWKMYSMIFFPPKTSVNVDKNEKRTSLRWRTSGMIQKLHGHRCFELHVGSKFHGIKVQTMGIRYISKLRTFSRPSETNTLSKKKQLAINSNIAKQAARTLHENSRLALDHGLPAMPSSIRHSFWHVHRLSPQAQAQRRRKKNLHDSGTVCSSERLRQD